MEAEGEWRRESGGVGEGCCVGGVAVKRRMTSGCIGVRLRGGADGVEFLSLRLTLLLRTCLVWGCVEEGVGS